MAPACQSSQRSAAAVGNRNVMMPLVAVDQDLAPLRYSAIDAAHRASQRSGAAVCSGTTTVAQNTVQDTRSVTWNVVTACFFFQTTFGHREGNENIELTRRLATTSKPKWENNMKH